MLTLTDRAEKAIKNYFEEKDIPPTTIRLFMSAGWGGSKASLALDELKDGDKGITINNLDFAIERKFYESAQPFEIDYSDFGFSIKCNLPVPDTSGCGGCKCGE